MFKSKRSVIFLLPIMFAMCIFTQFVYAHGLSSNINLDQMNKGVVRVDKAIESNKKVKVMISSGDERYTYDLISGGVFPLQMGNGKYTIKVLENVSGNKYKVIESKDINLKLDNQNVIYQQSISLIDWSDDSVAIKIAKDLTKNAKTDKEKATLIYEYITRNISYDYGMAKSVSTGYIPDIDTIINTSQGICFDYAVLYASMMRSVGVPTKLIMGYNKDIKEHHAWNEVYLSENNQWITVDTTYDSSYVKSGLDILMVKNKDDYKIEKIY